MEGPVEEEDVPLLHTLRDVGVDVVEAPPYVRQGQEDVHDARLLSSGRHPGGTAESMVEERASDTRCARRFPVRTEGWTRDSDVCLCKDVGVDVPKVFEDSEVKGTDRHLESSLNKGLYKRI